MIDAAKFAVDPTYRAAALEPDAGGPGDRPLIIQFQGRDAAALVAAAKLVESRCDAVELNCGCPQKVAKRGGFGAFLLDEPDLLERLVRDLRAAVGCGVTGSAEIPNGRGEAAAWHEVRLRTTIRDASKAVATTPRRRLAGRDDADSTKAVATTPRR